MNDPFIEDSDFGKGCIYNLALFIAHEDRLLRSQHGKMEPWLWFDGAADHMYEFLPNYLPEPLKKRGDDLKKFVLDRKSCSMTSDILRDEDAGYSLGEAKAILLEIDKLNGVPAIEARWK